MQAATQLAMTLFLLLLPGALAAVGPAAGPVECLGNALVDAPGLSCSFFRDENYGALAATWDDPV